MSTKASTVLSDFAFLEAPRWRDERLWFSDFYTHQVYSVREDGSDLQVEADVPEQPSGLGWLPDGGCSSSPCATAGSCGARRTARSPSTRT